MNKQKVTVAVINSNEDTVEMLRQCLEQTGFSSVVTGHIHDIKTGHMDFVQYLQKHDPKVIIWDIAIPYDKNWTFLHQVLNMETMQDRKIVLTTTNKRRLDELVGPTDAFEIVGKPYDLREIVKAVEKAVDS
jgi:CheY-like chemotaxis protein